METLQRTANRGSISTGFDIDNSVKIEPVNDEGLHFTPSSTTNTDTFTFSCWFKRTEISNQLNSLFGSYTDGSNHALFRFKTDDTLELRFVTAGTGKILVSDMLFRDTSAWYHMVLAVDTTDGTTANRVKVYINGEQITLTGDYPNQNQDCIGINTASKAMNVGYLNNFSNVEFSGYMADVYFVDGQQLAATDFGEYDDDSGIWIPKQRGGSYGTNGFKLEFKNSSNLGEDTSGNSNNFTAVNLAAIDQATDTPTNNFCTLNFNTGYIQGSDATTFTQGATTRQGGSGSYNGALGTMGINPFVGSAKWYWEVELSANNNGTGIELAAGWLATSIAQSNTSNKATAGNGAGFQIWTSFDWSPPTEGTGADGDIFGFLLQCDSSSPSLKIYKNDTLFTTRLHSLPYDFENDFYFPVVFIFNTGLKAFCNFGNPFDATISSGNTDPNSYGNFEFDTKGGYALCTKNLEEFG